MPPPIQTRRRSLPNDELQRTVLAIAKHNGNVSAAAREMGIAPATLRHRLDVAEVRGVQADEKPPTFTVPPLPSGDEDIEALIERMCSGFERRDEAEEARRLIHVDVHMDGPVGIVHFGDPHVDDDGCNWPELRRHLDAVRHTPGLLGATVGDLQNNWVGRLARLYANQETSHRAAWRLVEWFVRRIDWLYIVKGNHDVWSGNSDPLDWMARGVPGVVEPWGARLNLRFPNGKQVRVNARHDFAGHSMWNVVHGPVKAATMGWRDHILTCGHKHASGHHVLKDPASGLVSHAIRCAGYKHHDHYGSGQLGLPNQNIFSSAVTVIDPRFEDDDARLVTTLYDVETAAGYLTYLRERVSRPVPVPKKAAPAKKKRR